MRFRTVIRHKPGTVIDVAGESIALQPDANGYAEFETTNQRAIARLLDIPEGFAPLPDLAVEHGPTDFGDLDIDQRGGATAADAPKPNRRRAAK